MKTFKVETFFNFHIVLLKVQNYINNVNQRWRYEEEPVIWVNIAQQASAHWLGVILIMSFELNE